MTDLNKIDPNILQEYQKSYRPYYNYRADYQTDAPSYFDYLGNLNKIFTSIIDSINQQVEYVDALSNKDIKIEDTETIKLLMEGDFKVDNQILLKGRLKVSDAIENRQYQNKTFDIRNAITVKDDGIYIRDYTDVIAYLSELIENNKTIINSHKQVIDDLISQDTQMNKKISDVTDRVTDITSSGELATSKEVSNVKAELESLKMEVNEDHNLLIQSLSSITSYQNKNNQAIKGLADRISALEG